MPASTDSLEPSARKRARSARWAPGLPRPIHLAQLVFPFGLLGLWQLLALLLDDFFVAGPVAAVDAFVSGLRAGELAENVRVTMLALAYGYGLAVIFGLLVGLALGLSRFAYEVFEPIVIALYAVPKVTLFPIFLFIFGLGIAAKSWFALFFGVFPIIIFTMTGAQNLSGVLLKVGRSLRLSRLQLVRAIIVPAVLPSIVTGLRLGFGVTFLGVVLGEMFASRHGLGFALIQSVTLHDMPKMYALVFFLTLIAFVVNGAFLVWEWALTHHRPTQAVAF